MAIDTVRLLCILSLWNQNYLGKIKILFIFTNDIFALHISFGIIVKALKVLEKCTLEDLKISDTKRQTFPYTDFHNIRVRHAVIIELPFILLFPILSGVCVVDIAQAEISYLTTSSPIAYLWGALNFNRLHSTWSWSSLQFTKIIL